MDHPGSYEAPFPKRNNVINILKIKPYWKKYDDGTEILHVHGVQIVSVQPSDTEGNFEVYCYDSDFQELFQSLDEYEFIAAEEAKNKVENIFAGWLKKVYDEFTLTD